MVLSILGDNAVIDDFMQLDVCSDGIHKAGINGVESILATKDGKVEFILWANHALAYVKSALGFPAYYPVNNTALEKPIKAILMDLDGTSVRSEEFWIWVIQLSIASLLGNLNFELEQSDLPYVSGHSVSEHLEYCVQKYCPDKKVEQARKHYFEHTSFQMEEIMSGRGRKNAFKPVEGLKEFLMELKARDIKIGLVTSGLYEKAWPEILSAFNTLNMGDPKDFYDAIITAGFPLRKGEVGTLGELSPKPHPWLYAEVFRVGLGMDISQRANVLGMEDSAAGVCSIKLAGLTVVGVAGGNIEQSSTKSLCDYYCHDLLGVLKVISD